VNAEPVALLEKGDHRGLEALSERGGAERRHRHDEEPVGDAGAEARLARVVFVVVDGVVVAREPEKRRK